MRIMRSISWVLTALILMALIGCTPGSTATERLETGQSEMGEANATSEPASTLETEMNFETEESVTEQEEVTEDAVPDYEGTLDRYYKLIASGAEDYDPDNGETGVFEVVMGMGSEDALDHIGYAILDISGDGVPELLIGAIEDVSAPNQTGSETFAVYHQVNGETSLTFDGWGRNGYRYLGEGKFLYQGSSGAMYSIFGTYTISPDGSSLSNDDYYFTYEKDETFEEIGFYHNTIGEMDKAVSKELDMTAEEFWQMEEALMDQVQGIELTHFRIFEETQAMPVTVHWAAEAQSDLQDYEEFVVDATDAQTQILFTSKTPVKEFKLLALTITDVDEDGYPIFETEELFAPEDSTLSRPLLVKLTFHGDLPSYGVSYLDETDTLRLLALSISGEDGSISLIDLQ